MADSPDILMRKEKGKQGKLWRIEVLYRLGNETKRATIDNRLGEEVMRFREKVFSVGLMLPVEPGRWRVIHPTDVLTIDLWRQKKYFENDYK